MGIAGSGPQCRIEPLSNAQLPEWDLLVTGGNLAAAPGPQDVTRLLAADHAPGFLGSILGLAGAYAAYAARDWPTLDALIEPLRQATSPPVGRPWLDVELLALASHHRNDIVLPAAAADQLAQRATHGEVPLLVWGVSLALRLLDRSDRESASLTAWQAALRWVARRLAPHAVWTAWRE
jgi:hypothetical protein